LQKPRNVHDNKMIGTSKDSVFVEKKRKKRKNGKVEYM
jgi:hypothetical protein